MLAHHKARKARIDDSSEKALEEVHQPFQEHFKKNFLELQAVVARNSRETRNPDLDDENVRVAATLILNCYRTERHEVMK